MSGAYETAACIGCHRSPEGDYYCTRFGGWHLRCPIDEYDGRGDCDDDDDCDDDEMEVR